MTNISPFTAFAHPLLGENAKKNTTLPLKNHPQIPLILDALGRFEQHHIILNNACAEKINYALTESVAQHISNNPSAKTLRQCDFIYCDLYQFARTPLSQAQIKHDIDIFLNQLRTHHKRGIIVINELELLFQDSALSPFRDAIKTLLFENTLRFIIFTRKKNPTYPSHLKHLFTTLHMITPTKNELLALLKIHRTTLEDFHHVIIPDDVFANAYSFSMHYLGGESCFNNTLKLLDSAAARASLLERNDSPEHKPLVTTHILIQMIATWTQIPFTHLQNNKFQPSKLIDGLNKHIFGQDAGLSLIASILQNACLKLQEKSGPFCNFLFVGSTDVGKTETAYALADYLFGHKDALFHIDLNKDSAARSLADINISSRNNENRSMHLLDAISETPYAIILLENIEKTPQPIFNLFKDILIHGYLFDEEGNKYDFRHAIIIMTTQLTAERINHLLAPQSTQENTHTVDLMQLVLSENVLEPSHQHHPLSPQELCDEIFPNLAEHFSFAFLQHANIIPFIPLDYSALEKIIRLKIKALAKRLEINFGIELSFASEAIKFLAHELFWQKPHTKSLDKLLEQHLYACIAHEVLAHAEEKNKLKRLLVRLNDSGQLLRCEFITSNEATLYNL